MSGTQDALKVQFLFAVAQGTGGLRISREASAWLSAWLQEMAPSFPPPSSVVCEDQGRGFLARLHEIGEQAREIGGGGLLRVEALMAAAGQSGLAARAGLEMEAPLEETVFGQIVFALARGAGDARLSVDACGWFHDRYAPWLTATKLELVASPLEVWEAMGNGFLSRFKAIGEGVRSGVRSVTGISSGEISREELQASAWEVESESPCPYCPSEPPPGVEEEDAFGPYAGLGSGSLPRFQLPA